ncbi:hypothetical protein [Marinobacter salicampi]|uniref:hypothetical protein n=1 Tax=Marinobacter salicampi TaxID=435907 RepID=UPI00140DAF15|nr:hypothetical protein [Marinobacter salicampi]
MLTAAVPFLVFVAILTGTLPVPIDPEQNPVLSQLADIIIIAGAFISGIGGLLLTFAIGKVQREIRIELANRK